MDKENFIEKKTILYADKLDTLYKDIINARSKRGWSNGGYQAPADDGKTKAIGDHLLDIKNLISYNGQQVAYKGTFPAFSCDEGSVLKANFVNEIQLAINDINNGAMCSSGCTAICVGCSNECSGSACRGNCGSNCTSTCSSACGGSCASRCSTCSSACRGGSR